MWGILVACVCICILLRKLLRKWRKCPSNALMEHKTVIITGANCGIGKATALEMARRKARVILACRTLKSAQDTAREIETSTKNGEIVAKELNLASMTSIHEFCKEILEEESHIHVLINNAGVFCCPYSKTEDGLEMQMGVNHFGHFLLTFLLLDRLMGSVPSRIVNVASGLYVYGIIPFHDIHSEQSYNMLQAYHNSKLANCLFTRELGRRLQGTGTDVFAVHPGPVATNAARHFLPKLLTDIGYPLCILFGLRDPEEGCQTSVYCSVEESLKGHSGEYYYNCKSQPWAAVALDDEAAEKLWTLSEKLTHIR